MNPICGEVFSSISFEFETGASRTCVTCLVAAFGAGIFGNWLKGHQQLSTCSTLANLDVPIA
jgi:hypothetical protein